METLMNNETKMKYSLYVGEIVDYERDEDGEIIYEDIDGTMTAVESGTHAGYLIVNDFEANISFGGQTSEAEYGLNVTDYDASIVTNLNQFPFDERTIIFVNSEPVIKDGEVQKDSADFIIKAVRNSLNQTKYLLKAIPKGKVIQSGS